MGKVVVVEWLTLDGIFDANLFDQWFFPFDSLERQEYISQTTQASIALLYGHQTYKELAAYWSTNTDPSLAHITQKLNDTPKYVVSNQRIDLGWQNTTSLSGGDIVDQIAALKSQPNQLIHVNGSATLVKWLAEKGLVDELHLLIHPIVLGRGKRFFVDSMSLAALQPTLIRPMEKGVVLVSYQASI